MAPLKKIKGDKKNEKNYYGDIGYFDFVFK